jgi:peptidoglycan/LPS O-acetylase OafA/YrhL
MRKIEEFEILRAFAALGVVVLHVGNSAQWASGYLLQSFRYFRFEQVFIHFAVPLFTLISGCVLGLKYRGDFSVSNFYKKRALSIIPPYLLFSLIYTAYRYLSPNFYRPGLEMESSVALSEVLFNLATGKAINFFWFFVCIAQLYLLYPLLIRFVSSRIFKNNPLIFFILILLIDYRWYFIKNEYVLLFNIHGGFITNIISMHIKYSFISLLLYFVIGMYMSNDYDSVKSKLIGLKPWFIYLFFFLYAPFEIYYNIHPSNSVFPIKLTSNFPEFAIYISAFFKPLCIISVIILLYKLSINLLERNNHASRLFMYIGRYSFGIYLIHFLIIRQTTGIIYSFYEPFHLEVKFYLLTLISTVLLSIGSLRLISCLPYSKYLVGNIFRNPK